MDSILAFARNFSAVKYDDLPGEVVVATKKEILDLFAVALGGSSRPGVEELRQLVTEWGGKEESTVFGWGHRLPAFHAAQLNATMGYALEFQDVHMRALTHPGGVIIPTCLAMAERRGKVSGKEFITSVALGVDMICRLGVAAARRPGSPSGFGWHPTTLNGFLGAAAVSGRLLGLDEEGMVNALGLAYHQASGNGQCFLDGATSRSMGPGFAARGGIVSALMAEKGITGARNSLEGKFGLFNQYHRGGYDAEALTAGLGSHFEGVNVFIKPYRCATGNHTSIDAALALVARHRIEAGEVKEVVVRTGEGNLRALGLPLEEKRRPRTAADAQGSIPWGVAVAVARGQVTIADFTEEGIRSPQVLEVSEKVSVEQDDALSRPGGLEPARVTITTKGGDVYEEEVEHPLGSPQRPVAWSDLERKLRDCTSYGAGRLTDGNLGKLVELAGDLDGVDDVREIIQLVKWE